MADEVKLHEMEKTNLEADIKKLLQKKHEQDSQETVSSHGKNQARSKPFKKSSKSNKGAQKHWKTSSGTVKKWLSPTESVEKRVREYFWTGWVIETTFYAIFEKV